MSFYDNMSGSEDGQLRSPNDEHYNNISGDDDDHDTHDSLDIKPPQAHVAYGRESMGARRKEKKHSKERKHKERHNSGGGGVGNSSGRDRNSREHRRNSRGESGSEREQRRSDGIGAADAMRRDFRREEQRVHEMNDRYHHRSERDMLLAPISGNDRRYPKHGGGGNPYHYVSHQAAPLHHHHQTAPPTGSHHQYAHHAHHHPPPPQMHMAPRLHPRHDYYHTEYHHHGGGGGGRHHGQQLYDKHMGEYAPMGVAEVEPRRSKHAYEQPKDAESLEQDLRSRLLSKRHKYVKEFEVDDVHHYERNSRDIERRERGKREVDEHELERAAAKAERHKLRREKERGDVIELLDSPDQEAVQYKRKRKHHSREERNTNDIVEQDQEPPARRKTPDDPELLARRAKLLAAEREKEKRKETAREELEARREMLRERNDALSPSAVAASVTAGLNVVKRKQKTSETKVRKKRTKRTHSDDEDDDDDDDESDVDSVSDSQTDVEEHSEDESGSETAADSGNSETEVEKQKRTTKKKKHKSKHIDEDEDVPLPDSPLSIGALYKSPKKKKHRKKSSVERVSSRSRSRSTEASSHSSRHSSRSSRSDSHSPSHSRSSRSRSRTSRSRSASSGTRSEERGMNKSDVETDTATTTKQAETAKLQNDTNAAAVAAAVPCDEKGAPLPNYFPGIQGCRSVEEFQCLNRIEEGTYGVVYRAKDKRTNEIVALKRLKMEKEKEGFPITSLREINTLLKGQHPNIVTVREIVVGSNMDKIFIVMDYVEHDLKSLMETMKNRKQSFFPGEVKCLLQQLLMAVAHLHDNWILHRDLKTSNLLLSHKGVLKVGDFGLAREYGSPLKKYTSLVVTLWYRAPELLLCSSEYSTPIDVWSVGCIFAEFLQMLPLVPGKSEVDQLNRIFKELGTPNEKIWPGYNELPAVKNMLSQNSHFADYPISQLRKHFIDKTSEMGIALLQGLLTYDPKQRLTADGALKHAYFKELPLPIDPSMFPTWPAKSELGARKANSPKPPSGGSQFKQLGGGDDVVAAGAAGSGAMVTGSSGGGAKLTSGIITGNKKSATNTGFVLNSGLTQRQLAMGPGFSLKF